MDEVAEAPVIAGAARPAPRSSPGFVLVHIDTPRPGQFLPPGLLLSGGGWIVSESEVVGVEVFLDEVLLGNAMHGLMRADIAERFAHYPTADHAGLSFSVKMPTQAERAKGRLVLRIRTADGAETRKSVPVLLQPSAATGAGQVASVSAWPIRMSLESARIDPQGILRLGGWVVSHSPIRELAAFVGDVRLGALETGLERPDVAARFADYANAAQAGFRLIEQAQSGLGNVVRLQAVCEDGTRRQVMMPLDTATSGSLSVQAGSGISMCCETAVIQTDGTVAVAGWAVAESGIATVAISLDGVPLAEAETGQGRPDIGNRYPRIPSARHAGFRLRAPLPSDHADSGISTSGDHLLGIRAQAGDGAEHMMQIPLRREPPGATQRPGTELGGGSEIRYSIDQPALNGDVAAAPTRDMLMVAGWAVCRDGIQSVEVFIDNVSVGLAYLGVRREDVAALFPDHDGSLLSGFALTVARRLQGNHTVDVVIRGRSGQSVERRFQIVAEMADDSLPGLQLRRHMSQRAIDLGMASLGRRGHLPMMLVIVRSQAITDTDTLSLVDQTLDSLAEQAFDRWRVVLVGDFDSAEAQARLTVRGLADRVTCLPGLAAADVGQWPTADYVSVVQAGDRLAASALLDLAVEGAGGTDRTLVYGDDRRWDRAADAVRAWLKPDWSPDLLRSTNYIGRAWSAPVGLLAAAGIKPTDLSSLGCYDLVLRLTDAATSVRHIPKVVLEETSGFRDDPVCEQVALAAWATRRGISAQVTLGAGANLHRLKRELIAPGLVSIIIPTCGARDLVRTAITSIRDKTRYGLFEIICIDSVPEGQADIKQWLRENADHVIETREPFNWSRYNSLGAQAAIGDYLLFLNDDIEVLDSEWLDALLENAQRPEVAIVGPLLLYPDGKVQHAGMFLAGSVGRHAFRFAPATEAGPFGLVLSQRNVAAVTGACMAMRRQVYEQLGGFDEAHGIINNDLDFCMRARQRGFLVVYTPHARLIHHELASRATTKDIYDEERFARDWGEAFARGDPYFHPALSQATDDYAPELEPVEVHHVGRPILARRRVRSILAVKLDHIGDFVLAFPALHRLKQRFPNARLVVLGAAASRSLAAMVPEIDEFIEFNLFHERSDKGGLVLGEAAFTALQAQLRIYDFDIAVDLRMHGDTRHVLTYANAKLLAGYDQSGRFPWLDVALEWEGDRGREAKRSHAGDRLLQLIEAVSVACEDGWRLPQTPDDGYAAQPARTLPTPDNRAEAGAAEPPLVCVHPGAGSTMKQWPAASFAQLIDMLVSHHGVRVVLIGVGAEEAVARDVVNRVRYPAAVQSLVGQVPLQFLPEVLRRCQLYIGNDSGPKHLAAALGVPTVGIHSGNVDATEWGPAGTTALVVRRRVTCSPCYLAKPSDCHRDLACLHGIRPSDVFRACRSLLRATLGIVA